MTIYDELVERVSNGEKFHIDFEKQIIKVGKDYLIKNGEYDKQRSLFKDVMLNATGVLNTTELFYEQYKYSLPSERSDKKRTTYFKALPMDKIPDERLFVAERREVAQAKLEGFILCLVLEKKFVWNEDVMGKWFWQSKADDDLVILRKWIENN